jgi:hypothetical protein
MKPAYIWGTTNPTEKTLVLLDAGSHNVRIECDTYAEAEALYSTLPDDIGDSPWCGARILPARHVDMMPVIENYRTVGRKPAQGSILDASVRVNADYIAKRFKRARAAHPLRVIQTATAKYADAKEWQAEVSKWPWMAETVSSPHDIYLAARRVF